MSYGNYCGDERKILGNADMKSHRWDSKVTVGVCHVNVGSHVSDSQQMPIMNKSKTRGHLQYSCL